MKKVKSTLSMGKRIILLSLCMTMFSVAGFSQGAKGKKVKGAPVFLQAVYQGNDRVYNENPLQASEFYNPILQGCFPRCAYLPFKGFSELDADRTCAGSYLTTEST